MIVRDPRPHVHRRAAVEGYDSPAEARAAVTAEERGRRLRSGRAAIARLAQVTGVRPDELVAALFYAMAPAIRGIVRREVSRA